MICFVDPLEEIVVVMTNPSGTVFFTSCCYLYFVSIVEHILSFMLKNNQDLYCYFIIILNCIVVFCCI